jgi:hypothetical protein
MNNLLRLTIVCVLLAFAVTVIGVGMARNTADLAAPFHLLMFLIAAMVYVLPTGLAFYRDCKAIVPIALVNVFLGWTIAGWFVAFGWAASGKREPMPTAINHPPSRPIPGH